MKLIFTRFLFLAVFLVIATVLKAQNTFIGGGNSWEVNANWQDLDADLSGDIGDVITENVTLNTSTSALINNGFNYTIGDLAFGNGSTLSINSTGSLNVGQAGTPKNVTANNNATINVSGTLVIWGNLSVNTNLTWNITGTVIIKGNVLMNDNATMFATGNLTIEGNFTGGDQTDFTILGGGHAEVYGTVTVGNNSHFTGPAGSFHAHACSQGTASDYCTGGLLPVELLYFRAIASTKAVNLSWSTASELNFDYFIIEKSSDAITYYEIGQVQGNGNSNIRRDYTFSDPNPNFGKTYYRLTEVDYNKSMTRLRMVAVDFTASKSVSVSPNPVSQGQVNIDLNFVPEHDAMVSIIDLRGVTLLEQTMSKQGITIPLQVSPGIYLVRVQADDVNSISRLVVK